MKKILSFLLALVILTGAIPMKASSLAILNGHGESCEECKEIGDADGNGVVDMDDAFHLLYYVFFPERFSLGKHYGHTSDCQTCKAAGDLDGNGAVDEDDAIYLLFHTVFPEYYPLHEMESPALLSVGYARGDITPEDSMEIYGSTATSAHDPLQMTCTAVCDGKNTALLFSLDLRNISESFTAQMTDIIEEKFGIPADHVMFNITHTHSAPNISNGTAAGVKWRQKMCDQLPVVVQAALDDMDVVKGVYTGKGHTDGITFVRRYLMPDGTYKTNPASGTATAHETEADNEMRTIRIDRMNKKDVVMVNYQTHYGSATGLYKGQYSADFVHEFRQQVEAEMDCHFVYHSGASGNLNFASAIPGERKYSDFIKATTYGLIPTMKDCLASEERVNVGELQFASSRYEATVYPDSVEDRKNAAVVNSSGYATDSEEYIALCAQYGFAGYRQVQGIMTRASLGETVELPFYAISFGDIGFASSPYEMFDTNGVQVREGSPFKMTFVCSYTNGSFGYVPSSIAFPHGAYEVFVSRFTRYTGDACADEMVRLLKECYVPGMKAESSFGESNLFT